MKTERKSLFARFIALFSTRYDVPEDAPYSAKSMAEQKLIQDAAAFIAEHEQCTVVLVEPNIPGARPT